MSNMLRKKANKNNKRKRGKEHNSWAYVIFASIVDLIFSFSWHESIPSEPIFGLSDSLGELGKKRQERLAGVLVGILFLAGVFCTIHLCLKYGNTQRRIASALLTGALGLALVVMIILNKKRK